MATTIQASIIANGQYNGGGGPTPPVYQYLLDNYPGAVGAYSLRKLNYSYTGPAIQVRRDSDDATSDIYFIDGQGLDINSLLNFVGSSNGFVTTWYDQSGNGRNLTQTFGIQQPLICTNGFVQTVGSKPSLYFFGFEIEIYLNWNSFASPFQSSTVAFTAKCNNIIGPSIGISEFVTSEIDASAIIRTIDNSYAEPPLVPPYTYRATETIQDENDLTYPDGSFFFNGSELTNANDVSNYHLGFVNAGSAKNTSNFFLLNLAQSKNWRGYIQEYIVWQPNYAATRPDIESNINSYYNIY